MTNASPVYTVAPARGRFLAGATYLKYHNNELIPYKLDDKVLSRSAFYADELNDVIDRVCAALRGPWRPT